MSVRGFGPLFLLFFSLIVSMGVKRLPAAELDAGLETWLASCSDDERVSVFVSLADQADIGALDRVLKRDRATRQERHERVVRALQETAVQSQPALIEYLTRAKSRGEVTGFTPHWITNLIVVEATKREILRILNQPAVGVIEKSVQARTMEPVTRGTGSGSVSGIGVTPGLRAINADRVWHELGFTGNGRLVANLDTGVEGSHPALVNRWRGQDPDVDWSEAWFDVAFGTSKYPVDVDGHGTHVMGTITGLGEETADTIGVAWRAKWIACNGTSAPGPTFDSAIIAAFEWFADPDGDPATIDDVPDVVQNSWGMSPGTCDSRWWAAIDNSEAAGVVVTWSAGNEGPVAYSLRSPADRATTPYNIFSVGAVDATNYGFPYPIAGFSSRGPSRCRGPYEIKPEVSAPGVDVYSCVRTGGYEGNWSGTSMAGPHVAGVVALMREAQPNLTVDQIKEVLMASAHDFGDPGEDNTYGRGFIDAYRAVVMVMNGIGQIHGTVIDDRTEAPVYAELEILETGRSIMADSLTGDYSFIVPGDSTFTIRASHFGYEPAEQRIHVVPDDTTTVDFRLVPSPNGFLGGMVMDSETGLPIPGAEIEILDTPIAPAFTGDRGFFSMGQVPTGYPYDVHVDVGGYIWDSEPYTVLPGAVNLVAFPMESGYQDDMEEGAGGWTHDNVTPGYHDQWHRTSQNNHTDGGRFSWKCGRKGGHGYQRRLDAGLVTPEIPIGENDRLSFWHWIDMELRYPDAVDGAIVEISIDGGEFQQITPVGGYPYRIMESDNPLPGGTPCFSGFHFWRPSEFDLSGLSGRARIRFRVGSNGATDGEGWYIDDLIVAPNLPPPPVSIMLLPAESGIEFGPAGGRFTYQRALVNNTADPQIFDWWTDVSIGPRVVFGPIESHTDTLAAREIRIVQEIDQEVAEATPPGTYNFNGKVGLLPDTHESISSFQFTKTE